MSESISWFDALGESVPHDRRVRAIEEMREMGLDLGGGAEMDYISEIATAIENDRPNKAIATAREELDLTGSYRLLAYLCVDEDPRDTEASDATN